MKDHRHMKDHQNAGCMANNIDCCGVSPRLLGGGGLHHICMTADIEAVGRNLVKESQSTEGGERGRER